MMKILFRVDSSNEIGIGHLMRCMVLAKKYENDNIAFLSATINEEIIKKEKYKLIKLSSNNIAEFIFYVKKIKPDLVIIDSYEIGYKEEKELKKNLTCKLLVFDDTYEKHYADIVLNHNIYAKKSLYQNKVPSFCELWCGKEYTLLRKEFIEEKQKKREKDGIFLSLGGSDAKNRTFEILKKIPKSLHVKIATTSSNANLSKLLSYKKKHTNFSLHVNASNIAKLMNESLFGIITPSVIANEALFLKLPFIAVKVASNQKYMCEYLNKIGITCKKNLDKSDILKALQEHGINF